MLYVHTGLKSYLQATLLLRRNESSLSKALVEQTLTYRFPSQKRPLRQTRSSARQEKLLETQSVSEEEGCSGFEESDCSNEMSAMVSGNKITIYCSSHTSSVIFSFCMLFHFLGAYSFFSPIPSLHCSVLL